MAFTFRIEQYPDTLKILHDIQKERQERGKNISLHGSVILAINQYENYRKLIADKNKVIEQQDKELQRLREITKSIDTLKKAINYL
jgi:flagellar biosynthesis chaperone FliJ